MKIEKNVPLPPPAYGPQRRPYADVIDALQPGDSVLIDEADRSRITAYLVRMRIPYATRKVKGGVRVWRLE